VLGTAVWSAINEPRPGHLQIIEELLVAGARLVEAGYPPGDEEVGEGARRHRAASSPNHALHPTPAEPGPSPRSGSPTRRGRRAGGVVAEVGSGRVDRSVGRSPCARRCHRTNGTSLGSSLFWQRV